MNSLGTVAIVGAGPGGIVAARYLRHVGFSPVLFDRSPRVGGQWCVGSPHSGVWPGMHTNTSRVMTAFSDLPHPEGTAAFPRAEEIQAYLERYATQYGVLDGVRLGTQVEEIERDDSGDGWIVSSRDSEGAERREHFAHVVIAPGRHHRPIVPHIDGLNGFTGAGGVRHAAEYRGAGRHRGERVVVAGCAISALELASELAMEGAERVVVAARRHRYVLQRMLAGVPLDHRVYTRAGGMAWETFPADVTGASLKAFTLRTSGHPSQFGAPVYSEDFFEAGFSHSPFYMQLVAEGRIVPRPFIARVDGTTVHFTDGRSEEADTIILCTGYSLHLPFLGSSIRAAINPDTIYLDLFDHTFHPDLPGLAFVGMYEYSGPFFPTLEQQARWIAYTWGGVRPAPAREVMERGVASYRARRGGPYIERMHILSRLFARHAGAEPDPARWPDVARALYFGPLSPASFRLEGTDALPDAAARVAADGAAFGAITDGRFTDEEMARLRALAEARGDSALAAFVSSLR